jgi:predicted flap endonuclease-1-like 5' DNA nuclease
MTPETPDPAARPRQTLAMRLAERERQRAERAERLARLRPAPPAADDAEAALEEFLRALAGAGTPAPEPAPGPAPGPAAVLHFQRPEAALVAAAEPEPDTDDLDRLPGAGPGLVAALRRAGLARLADIAPLAPETLAARLGPLGRLVPAAAWVAAARDAAPPA